MSFRALYLQKNESGFTADITTLQDDVLNDHPLATGEVLVRVLHSSLNYKDGLAVTNTAPVVRSWPMVAGIDGAGEVISSADPRWKPGDRVGVGWHGGHCFECNACRKGLFINCEKAQVTGISYDGGYAEYAVVPSAAAARIPESLDAAKRCYESAIELDPAFALAHVGIGFYWLGQTVFGRCPALEAVPLIRVANHVEA